MAEETVVFMMERMDVVRDGCFSWREQKDCAAAAQTHDETKVVCIGKNAARVEAKAAGRDGSKTMLFVTEPNVAAPV